MHKPFRTLGYAALLGFLVQTPGLSQVDDSRYQFRVTVDLISLNVTVTDTRNRFITDLLQEEFSVFEDGISQEVSVFSREDLPIRNTPGCPIEPCNATHTSVTDIFPMQIGDEPDQFVDINDVFAIVLGFQGNEYPGSQLELCLDP